MSHQQASLRSALPVLRCSAMLCLTPCCVHAASLPLRGLNGGHQPSFAPVNMSAFRGGTGSRKRQPSVDNLKALAGN